MFHQTHFYPSFNCSFAASEAQNVLSPSPSPVLRPSALWFWPEHSHAHNTEGYFDSLHCSFGSQHTLTWLLCLFTYLLVCFTNHVISLDSAPIILQMPCWPVFGTILPVGCWFAMLMSENSALTGHYLCVYQVIKGRKEDSLYECLLWLPVTGERGWMPGQEKAWGWHWQSVRMFSETHAPAPQRVQETQCT